MEGFIQLKDPKSQNTQEKCWLPGKTVTRCKWIRFVGGLQGHHEFLEFSAKNVDSEVLIFVLELFRKIGANKVGRFINAAINYFRRARNVLSHYSSPSLVVNMHVFIFIIDTDSK